MNALEMIIDERQRQVEEGWTPEHDDRHDDGEMAQAAACYAMDDVLRGLYFPTDGDRVPDAWPWQAHWWKPSPDDRIRELVKAGALVVAEIERLQRAEAGE